MPEKQMLFWRGCAVILRKTGQLMLIGITHQVLYAFDLNLYQIMISGSRYSFRRRIPDLV